MAVLTVSALIALSFSGLVALSGGYAGWEMIAGTAMGFGFAIVPTMMFTFIVGMLPFALFVKLIGDRIHFSYFWSVTSGMGVGLIGGLVTALIIGFEMRGAIFWLSIALASGGVAGWAYLFFARRDSHFWLKGELESLQDPMDPNKI